MSGPKNKISRRELLIRILCGILAFLMIGSIAYTALYYLFL